TAWKRMKGFKPGMEISVATTPGKLPVISERASAADGKTCAAKPLSSSIWAVARRMFSSSSMKMTGGSALIFYPREGEGEAGAFAGWCQLQMAAKLASDV